MSEGIQVTFKKWGVEDREEAEIGRVTLPSIPRKGESVKIINDIGSGFEYTLGKVADVDYEIALYRGYKEVTVFVEDFQTFVEEVDVSKVGRQF